MKSFLKNQAVFLTLMVLAVVSLTGFVVWQFLFCPGCMASEQRTDSLGNPAKTSDLQSRVGALLGEQELNQTPQIGSPAPNFILENLEGDEVSLSDFAGKNVLLVFWATYCGYCEKERPDLNRFTEEQEGKIKVLAISSEPKETLKKYVQEKEINFNLLWDSEGKTQIKYLALGTPNHFLIDKQGKIVAARPGYASYQELLRLTESLEGR